MNSLRSLRGATAGRVRWGRVALAGVAAIAGLAANAGVASSSESATKEIQVRAIDSTDGKLAVDYMYNGNGGESARLTIDGKELRGDVTSLADAGLTSSVVVVLDNSAQAGNASLQLALEDVSQLRPQKGAISELGVVGTGGEAAKIFAQPSNELASVQKAIQVMTPAGGSKLWDGANLAAKMLDDTGATQRNVVLVAASADDHSAASYSDAVDALKAVGASVHVVALPGSEGEAAQLQDVVTRLGGSYQTATDQEFKKTFGSVASLLDHQYRLTVDSPPKFSGEFGTFKLSVGSAVATSSYRPGTVAVGAEAVKPIAIEDLSSAGKLATPFAKYLIGGLVALAAAGAFFAVANLVTRRSDGLKFALRHYDETYGGIGVEGDDQGLAKSAIIQRAVEVTGSIAEERGLLSRVETLLERADLPLRAPEALTFYLGGAVVSVILSFVLTSSWMVSLIVVLLALIAPGFVVDFLAKRRKKRFTRVLPDMLQLLAGTLRAGYSIGQGFEAVSGEVEEPMGKELRRAVTEARLGRPLDEALDAVAHRMDSEDFEWAVMAIKIQKEVGGNLAELLMTVSDTMVQRERLRRDVASLTAEGRMSAIILGLLPPGLGLAMYFMNKEYIGKLFSGNGLYLLGASLLMMVIGFFWMKKTITIEV